MTERALVQTWMWVVPLVFPLAAPVVALIAFVQRDIAAGLAAWAAGFVGYLVWTLLIGVIAIAAGA